MKKFQHLTIRHEDLRRLVALLDSMKEVQGKAFKLLKTETANYAKNIFKDQDKVACFKTDRKTLFESRVWLYIGDNGLVVANITSEINSRLGISNYNLVLNAFFREMVEPFIGGFQCVLTGENVSFSEILPENVFRYLDLWQDTCNKDAPISHPLDNEKWMNFVVAYHKLGEDIITPSDLEQWLSEDCQWPQGFAESIAEMGSIFEYSLDLLRAYDENINR